MTAAKNVYALMLALVIVLSGCFGNTADDTDAQTPDDTGLEMIAIGGLSNQLIINTTAGEMFQVHEASVENVHNNAMMEIQTTCTNGAEFSVRVFTGIAYTTQYQFHHPTLIPGAAFDCTHSVEVNSFAEGAFWSLVYSVVPVTLG